MAVDSAWGYVSTTLQEGGAAVTDSAWGYVSTTVDPPGKPNLASSGGEREAMWTVMKGGVEVTVTTWWIKQASVVIPLKFYPPVWLVPPAKIAGADPVGDASYPIPGSDVIYLSTSGLNVNAGTTETAPKGTLAAALAAVPTGGTIVVRGGVYHEGNIETSKACTIQNYPGEAVWFDGSIPFTPTWTGSGPWTAPYTLTFDRLMGKTSERLATWSGQPQRFVVDQLWLDGVKMIATVDNNTNPGAGKFSINQAADTITVGTNPNGKAARVVDLRTFYNSTGRTTLRGFGVRNYAPDQIEWRSGAIWLGGDNSTIEQMTVQHSSGGSVGTKGRGMLYRRNTFQDHGASGPGMDFANRCVFEQNIVRRINRNGYDPEPGNAGLKVIRSFEGIVVRDNFVEDVANGAGIWLDTTVARSIIANNTIIGTSALAWGRMKNGIEVEGSDGGFWDGVQHWSYVVGNRVSDVRSGGILIFDSGHIKVWNNQVEAAVAVYLWQDYRENTGNKAATEGTAIQNPWHTEMIEINNNNLIPASPFFTQIRAQANGDAPFKLAGGDMVLSLRGNWLRPADGNLATYWFSADSSQQRAANTLQTMEELPVLFGGPLAPKMSGNYQGNVEPPLSNAEPLPADVAAAYGVAPGLQSVGPILLPPVPAG